MSTLSEATRRTLSLIRGAAGVSAVSDADQAGLVGEDHGVDPVAQAELGEQAADVGFSRCPR